MMLLSFIHPRQEAPSNDNDFFRQRQNLALYTKIWFPPCTLSFRNLNTFNFHVQAIILSLGSMCFALSFTVLIQGLSKIYVTVNVKKKKGKWRKIYRNIIFGHILEPSLRISTTQQSLACTKTEINILVQCFHSVKSILTSTSENK